MQKHAFSFAERYRTVFAPLPVEEHEPLYFDELPVALPYAEDFPQLHYHDRYEVGICEEGEGLFLCEGMFGSVSKGDLIFVPPEFRHYSRSLHRDMPCRCRFVYLRATDVQRVLSAVPHSDAKERAEWEKRIPTVIREEEFPQAAALLRELVGLGRENAPPRASIALLRLSILLLESDRWFPTNDTVCQMTPSKHGSTRAADRIAEYLALHYRESQTAKELAALCHLSESQLRRQFWHGYGMPPIAYRNQLRCRIASELLCRTDLPVAEISAQVGYTATSDFYRAFRNFCGMGPSEYRKRKRTAEAFLLRDRTP